MRHRGIDTLTNENGNPIAKELIEVICDGVDCIHNDKSRFDLNQTGICSLDSIELKKSRCMNFIRDMFFLRWYWKNPNGVWTNAKKST